MSVNGISVQGPKCFHILTMRPAIRTAVDNAKVPPLQQGLSEPAIPQILPQQCPLACLACLLHLPTLRQAESTAVHGLHRGDSPRPASLKTHAQRYPQRSLAHLLGRQTPQKSMAVRLCYTCTCPQAALRRFHRTAWACDIEVLEQFTGGPCCRRSSGACCWCSSRHCCGHGFTVYAPQLGLC